MSYSFYEQDKVIKQAGTNRGPDQYLINFGLLIRVDISRRVLPTQSLETTESSENSNAGRYGH